MNPPTPNDQQSSSTLTAREDSAYIVAGYAAAVASDRPTPGGGSVAGVVGALAAALMEMVCQLSKGRAAGEESEAELSEAIELASGLRSRLLDLAAADEAAYRGYVAATKLPKTTEQEKFDRRSALQQMLGTAADVPLAVALACCESLQALERLASYGNKYLVSDVIAAALCAEAAGRAALLNVEVNARMMTDKERGRSYRDSAAELERAVREQAATVVRIATERL